MDDDCLKLTIYFGERKRTAGAFVAPALLDSFEKHEVATSVLLRGIEGFGLRHHVRADTSLSLSEDLPAVAVAVDTRSRIEAMLDEISQIGSGLITLERARMLTGELGPVELPEDLHEATKLTVYVGRQDRAYGMPAFQAVCDLFYRRGLSGATVFLGVDGTVHGRREQAKFFSRNADVPVMIIAVGAGSAIAEVVPELNGLLRNPLITLERVRVCKRDGELLERPHALPGTDEHGLEIWQKLMIYTSEAQLHEKRAIHREITRRLRTSGASGSTTIRGIWGFHGDHQPHGDKLFQVARHVPVVTIVIDTPGRIEQSFGLIDELTSEHGLVTSEMVPAVHARAGGEGRGGLRLSRHRF